VLADHGEEFAEHGGYQHGAAVYEESVRVPLLFWGPGRIPEARRHAAPVSLIDVAPTIVDLVGLPVPEDLDGISLKGVLLDGEELEPRSLISEARATRRWIDPLRHESWNPPLFAVRTGGRKFLVHRPARGEARPVVAFDLANDPGERSPLPVDPERARAIDGLVAKYLRGMATAKVPPPTPSDDAVSPDPADRGRARRQRDGVLEFHSVVEPRCKGAVKRVARAGGVADRDAMRAVSANATAAEIEPPLRSHRDDGAPPEPIPEHSQRLSRIPLAVHFGELQRHDRVVHVGEQPEIRRARLAEIADHRRPGFPRRAGCAQGLPREVAVHEQQRAAIDEREIKVWGAALQRPPIRDDEAAFATPLRHEHDRDGRRQLGRECHVPRLHALVGERPAQEPPLRVIAHRRNEMRIAAKLGRLDGGVARHAAGRHQSLEPPRPSRAEIERFDHVEMVDDAQPQPDNSSGAHARPPGPCLT
jgi:hypothetical protein